MATGRTGGMKTAGLMNMLAMAGAVAMGPAFGRYEIRGGRGFNTPSEPRLRHVRKGHPRSDAYFAGAAIDQDWNPREAARKNAEMELERKAHKARKLEEGRARVAAGYHRTRTIRPGEMIWLDRGSCFVRSWG